MRPVVEPAEASGGVEGVNDTEGAAPVRWGPVVEPGGEPVRRRGSAGAPVSGLVRRHGPVGDLVGRTTADRRTPSRAVGPSATDPGTEGAGPAPATKPVPVVELVDHAPAVTLPLPDAVGRALAAGDVLDAAPDPYTPGRWSLKAGSKVGAVAVTVPGVKEPVIVRVTPKVPVARLFFLLGYGLDPKGGLRDGHVEVGAHPELLPALAHTVERQVDRALRQGLLQGYRTAQETSLVVRGRIRETEQVRRRFGATLPVEVAYDEFTADIAENRILRAAVERLLRLPGVPRDVRRRLSHQRVRLADVTTPVRGRWLPPWQPTRLNSRYHQALRLARVVLEESSVEHVPGGIRVDGFLFDMNKLFEDFVTVALREACRALGHSARLQDSHPLDEATAIRMRPDFVLYGPRNVPCAVADAKYKAGKRDGFPDADLYQMLAYCTALGLPEGHLVYARGNAPHTSHTVRHAGIVIHQHALDLAREPAGLLAEVGQLAARLVTTAHE